MEENGLAGCGKRTQKNYSLAFKLQVVEEVEKGEYTYKQAQREYAVPVNKNGTKIYLY